MKIAVIGTGYVGLVTGTCFAESGNDVICVDVDREKIDLLRSGKVPIYEPGLEELIKRNVEEERIKFTTSLDEAVKASLLVFVCVGTPSRADGSPDMKYVLAAAAEIGRAIDGYRVVVMKSTVPVGTADKVRATIRSATDQEFDVVSNPEFLKEGAAIDDFQKPDRVVIGTSDVRCAAIMKELYAPFVRTGKPILVMDNRSAELTKYAANALLASRISFMNEVANLAELVGADVNEVRQGIGSDARIGHAFLFPGIGFGGSCFPKDVDALGHTAREHGYDFKMLTATNDVNRLQKRVLFEKARAHFKSDLVGRKLAIWGLAFKPKTDDMREAPSIELVNALLEAGAKVRAFDPVARESAKKVFGDSIEYGKKQYDVLEGAEALFVVTEWNEFRRPDFERMKKLMARPLIFDGRNVYDPRRTAALGFEYFGMGVRGPAPAAKQE
ncbi:UDP-glucose/GDP-mannose dehydrogenase family protein [bacterium]|nr:UDP-glucose/GDP-mannose dehydrogenase family protein [bacterium]